MENLNELKLISEHLPSKFTPVLEAIAKQLKGEYQHNNEKNHNSTSIFFNSEFCSSVYVKQNFILQSNVFWYDIPTPAFQSILDSQSFDAETVKWVYSLIGRGLYNCGDADNGLIVK